MTVDYRRNMHWKFLSFRLHILLNALISIRGLIPRPFGHSFSASGKIAILPWFQAAHTICKRFARCITHSGNPFTIYCATSYIDTNAPSELVFGMGRETDSPTSDWGVFCEFANHMSGDTMGK